MGAEMTPDLDINNWFSSLAYDQWVSLPVSGSRPSARYKHAAEIADGKLYITGGSRNGRYLSDIQVLDLRSLTWSKLKLQMEPVSDQLVDNSTLEALPATSGHSLVKWGSRLLLLGGQSKELSDVVTVRSIDPETLNCCIVKTSGKDPIARGGQSVTLVGSKLIMFGGEDSNRRLLNDIHILDLETMTWDVAETSQTPPSPRFDHTAAIHANRYLLIFGGCSHSVCFGDLHILDLHTLEWSQPHIEGDLVTPRAGHAGITINEDWYLVGGGDNRSGVSDTLTLNMSKLVWSVVTSVEERDPLASEGLTICSEIVNGEKFLVAFGGYYGKYNNEVYVLRTKPKDLSRPKIFQSPAAAAAAAAASVTAAYALTSSGERKIDVRKKEDANFQEMEIETSLQEPTVGLNLTTAEKKTLESSLTEIRTQNYMFKNDLAEINNTYEELSKELLSVKCQLEAETSRCVNLEAQISELQNRLESLHSIEDELQVLRNQKSAIERDMEFTTEGTLQKQNSGGVWQWIAGGTRSS
ncbi:hypothetical protein MKW94_001753 [Papaver nudicaule]|uniref:Acyl-CoA-binding domain-containing protein n=1 Tax=Papaver nudicaule TaxID=74823 RepID=A0AA41VE34_PAPNU|nr:hypothetical protein [Papaver nudicaule]